MPILTLPIKGKEYTIYSDVSKNELGRILIQDDKVIAYTSRQLKPYEKELPNPCPGVSCGRFCLKTLVTPPVVGVVQNSH